MNINKFYLPLRFFLIWLAVATPLLINNAFALEPAYWWHDDEDTKFSKSDWMKDLPDEIPLDRISMVGTHDSCGYSGGDAFRSQRLSLTKQLTIGIRAMDIWARHSKNTLYINHGIWYQHLTLEDVFKEVITFLYYHKKETVIMRISPDGTLPDSNSNTYDDAFKAIYNKYSTYFWKGPFNVMPKLKDIRGKIVILQKFTSPTLYGIPWNSSLKIQEHYPMKTNWDLYDRWERVKKHINDSYDSGGGKGIYINYLTGSGGSFPYFVASGKSSPQTGAPWLMTGRTTPGWKNSYIDWPRINCFIGICSIPFVGINYSTSSYVKTKHYGKNAAGYVGILLAAFPGQELIENVVAVNFPINPQFVCTPSSTSCNGVCVDLKTNNSNCGQCGKACWFGANSSATCENGVCGLNCTSGFNDCDKIPTNGCEKSLTTINDCLSCGNKCPIPANGAPICTTSGCSVGECSKSYAKCGSDISCSTNIDTSVDNCGGCGKKCSSPTNGSATCSGGTCGISCAQGFTKCGENCISQNTDINNCGGCGTQCPKPANGVAICESGVCGVSSCPIGLANCDSDLANGCETSILSDILSCGACKSACKIDNATGVCLNGSCGVSSCDTGYAKCGSQNGCLTNINTDINNCGSCGLVCDLANSQSSCSGGSCKVNSCSTGFKDCNGTAGDGCEINSLSDVNNCGGCGSPCAKPANGEASCVAGVCGIKTCEPGFADCDGNPANGCEVSINSDENNCNGCGKICPVLANGISKCENGSCGLKECIAGLGFMDCDKDPSNGCEAPINTTTDCGGCGPQFTCTAPSNALPLCLIGGSCATGGVCKEGFKDCNKQSSDGCEVDLNHDVDNCGECGTTCQPQPNGSPPMCTNGICAAGTCPTGLAHCPGNQGCQTPIDTINNCGSCGNNCSAPINKTALCTSGACEVSPFCNEGYGDCDNDLVTNGCETDLRSSTENCGTCGKTCNLSNSAGICMNSQCVPGHGTCQAGFAHCSGPDSEGCETPVDTVNNCGGCGIVCSSNGGTPSCGPDGKCSIACSDGYGDCNNDPSDGCEVDLKSSENNCKACGVVCNNTNNNPICNGGTCITGNCGSGFGKCGEDIGCSTPITTNENCGACGQICDLKDKNVAVSQCSSNGECKIVTCESNFVDCDGISANGCEVDITKVENCGTCGNNCPLLANTTAPFCKNNQGNYSCGIGACLPPFAHYSSNEDDGCETNTNTSVNHCGPNNINCPEIANGTPACIGGECGIGSCNPNYVDKNNSPSDGCEINTKEDILNCGAIGNVCSSVNGTPNCENSICGIQCSTGFGDCNEQPGCETNILTTPDHCGSCSVACSTANNSPSCIAGACVAGTCGTGFIQCSGDPGCNTNSNENGNCGSCGHTCSLDHANSTCSTGGTCIVTSCLPGWSDCNGFAIDGCETNIATIANCGNCNNSCNEVNNTPICTTGDCIIGTCLPGFGKCGSDPGCNTSLTDNDNNCGECGKKCDLPNVEVSKCSSSACTIVACKDGWLDCNGEAIDGCERDVKTIDNCGACNNKCNPPLNALSTICKKEEPFKYSCDIGSCREGWGNYDGLESNGCETNTNTSVDHCGPNNINCPEIANGTPSCINGVCGILSCEEGWADLNNNPPGNGCETNLKSDDKNCGTIGNICTITNASARCQDGECVLDRCNDGFGLCGGSVCLSLNTVEKCGDCNISCSFPNASAKCEDADCKLGICDPGFALCGGNTCIDLARDPNNCAQCGTVCTTPSNGSPICSSGSCNIACDPNYVSCSGSCIPASSLASDVLNCGSCGTHCTQAPPNGSPSCQNSTCGFTCDQGYTQCGNTCVALNNDILNCGVCGNKCSFAEGSPLCEGGDCKLGQCNLGFGNCDGNEVNGCEKLVNTSTQCGTCNTSCPEVGNQTPICLQSGTGGTCGSASCLPGFSDCDGNSENGCETNLNTTANHCGTCATSCTSATGLPICENGLCTTGTCNAGLADCNAGKADGCEINTLNDVNNCGGCNNVCSFDHGVPICNGGQCALQRCEEGFGNCNGISSDGCETQVNTLANCSTCGNECIAPPNQAPICLQGLTCAGAACATGFGDCDGNASNGCEANLNTSPNTCSSCGNTCSAPLNAHATCSTGTCDFICNDGYTRCGAQCISTSSLASDTNNCGSCGKVCASAPANAVPACIASGCSFACKPGYTKCGDGCISDSTLLSDTNNCGGCGNVCPIPANGTDSCQNGTCNIGSCNLGFSNCDGFAANGCETNILSTDITNCGACGTICTTQPNGDPAACVSGTCAMVTPLLIVPTSKTLAVRGTTDFNALGGVPPYVFSTDIATASIHPAEGTFNAGLASGSGHVTVTDFANKTAVANITINPQFLLVPNSGSVEVSKDFAFGNPPGTTALSGGILPYSCVKDQLPGTLNLSGANLTFKAPSSPGVAVITCTDSSEPPSSQVANITIFSGLGINPTNKTLTLNGTVSFSGTGGTPPYTFSCDKGTINPNTGFYTFSELVLMATITVKDAANKTAKAYVNGDFPNTWIWAAGTNLFNQGGRLFQAPFFPGARGHSSNWSDNNGNLYLQGGIGYGTEGAATTSILYYLWKYDAKNNTFTAVEQGSQNGNYPSGTLPQTTSDSAPSGRYAGSTFTDPTAKFLWLFGGRGYSSSGNTVGLLNDLWKYEIATTNWTWVHGSKNLDQVGVYGTRGSQGNGDPGARSRAAKWIDSSGNLWIFGGNGKGESGNAGYLNDIWKFNVSTSKWTYMDGSKSVGSPGKYTPNNGVTPGEQVPSAREAAVSWVDSNGIFWLFGGSSANGLLNDLWKYDRNKTSDRWTLVKGDALTNKFGVYGNKAIPDSANYPGSRDRGAGFTDNTGNIWLFGGYGYGASGPPGFMNDIWRLNTLSGTDQWVYEGGEQTTADSSSEVLGSYGTLGVAAESNWPGARSSSIFFKDSAGKFWFFGGSRTREVEGGKGDYYNDLWKFFPE